MTPISVLIVDDHPVIRMGIHGLLAKAPDIEIAGEAGNGKDALRMARELHPDILLLDMQLQGMSGLEVAKTLQKEGSHVLILVLSAYNDRRYIQEVLKCGASGYLIKEEAPEFILEAVRGVANGERGWISRRMVAQLASWQYDGLPPGTSLTPRETQVLDQVVEGKTNHEIGILLTISEKTVEKHIEAIFKKLGVISRTQAAVWGAREAIQNKRMESL